MAWIQDYHFGLAAEFLRAMRPSLFIHQFWHIPFPPPDILRLLPSGTHEALLRGLLGNDLMEFQIDRYAQNFLECVDRFVPDAKVDRPAGKVHESRREAIDESDDGDRTRGDQQERDAGSQAIPPDWP